MNAKGKGHKNEVVRLDASAGGDLLYSARKKKKANMDKTQKT